MESNVRGPELEMLKSFASFAEGAYQVNSGVANAAGKRRAFMQVVDEFNRSPAVVDSYPFYFMTMDDTGTDLSPSMIQDVVRYSVESNSDQYLLVVNTDKGTYLHFKHAGKDFAQKACKKFSLGWASLGGDGLVTKDFQVVGIFSASREMLERSLIKLKLHLNER